jgi:hypothetical protein
MKNFKTPGDINMDGLQMRKVMFLKFHEVVGKRTLLYGTKCSTQGNAEERHFKDTLLRFLRPFAGVIRSEHVRNENILQ